MRKWYVLTACLWLGVAHGAQLPSVVSIEVSGDDQEHRDAYLDMDVGLHNESRLLLSTGINDSINADEVVTRQALIGLRTDPLRKFSGGFDLEYWGEDDTFTIDTLRLVLDVNTEHWAFSLKPQWRTLVFFTDCLEFIFPKCRPEVIVKSFGYLLNMGYYTNGPWSFSLAYAKHDYNREVESLDDYPVFELLFSASTMELASGLEDYRAQFSVAYSWDEQTVGLNRFKSVAKVDGVESLVTTLRYSTALDSRWRLRLRGGVQSFSGGQGSMSFGSAGLSYSW